MVRLGISRKILSRESFIFLFAAAYSISEGLAVYFGQQVIIRCKTLTQLNFIVITMIQFINSFLVSLSGAVTVYKVPGDEAPALTRKVILLYIQVNRTRKKRV